MATLALHLCIVPLLVYVTGTAAQNSTNTSTPFNSLDSFTRLRAEVEGRLAAIDKAPPKYYPFKLPIYLSFEPLQIILVDEVSQSIMLSAAITLVWVEPSVSWDPKQYGGIESIDLEPGAFWAPTIYIPKTADNSVKVVPLTNTVQVSYKSRVSTLIPIITTTLCNLDLTFFPFDTHECNLVFIESGMYNVTSLELPPMGISSYFGTNAAWVLVGYVCNTQASHYRPIFDYIVCTVKMSRRSAFYVVNLIGPMAMTSLVTLVVFWLPAEGGEKMTFVVSMFLSSSVFYNYILEIMPRSMESPPRLNLLLVFNGLLIMLATAATAYVLRRYDQQVLDSFNQEQDPAPEPDPKPRKKMSCKDEAHSNQVFYSRKCNSVSPAPPLDGSIHNNLKIYDPDLHDDTQEDEKKPGRSRRQRLTYEQLDKIFFVLMSVLTVVVWACIFLI